MLRTTRVSALLAIAGLAAGASAQDIFWGVGPGVWNVTGNWSPQQVPNSASENARIITGGPVTLNISPTVGDLELGSGRTLNFNPNTTLSVNGDCTNNGFILLNPPMSTSNSTLLFTAGVTHELSGTGILRLGAAGDDAQLVTGASGVIHQLFGHTIDGAGNISAAIINDGVISALDLGSGSNRLLLFSSPKTNNKTIQANTGSVVEINGIVITQGPDGIIASGGGGTIDFSGSQSITGGRLIQTPGGLLLRRTGGNLTLEGVEIEGSLVVQSNATVIVNGATLQCSGTIELNDSGSSNNSTVQFNNDCLFSGGDIFLAGSGNDSQVTTSGGATLTVDASASIGGSGNVPASLVNNSLVHAYPSANGDGRLVLFSAHKTNNGTLRADDGGVLEISGIVVTQNGGSEIVADNGGLVDLVSSQTISGGQLRSLGTGQVIRRSNGTTTLTNVQLGADLPVQSNASVVYNGGSFSVNGTITLNDSTSANNGVLQFNNTCTLTGNATVFLAGSGNDSQITTAGGATLTLDPTAVVEGSGDVPAVLINNGLVRAFPSKNGDGVVRLFSGFKTNNTTMRADTGGTLSVEGIVLTQAPAAELLADGGTIHLPTSQTIDGGTIRTANGGSITRPAGGTTTLTGARLLGDFPVSANATIVYNGSQFEATGTITLNNSGSANNAVLQFNNTCTLTGGTTVFLAGSGNDSQITTAGGATLTLDPTTVVEGSGDIPALLINNGLMRAVPSTHGDGVIRLFSSSKTNNTTMRAETGGTIAIDGIVLTQDPAAEVLADGGTINLPSSQTINNGTIRAINGGTVIRPANGTTTLTNVVLDADLPIAPNSTLLYNGPQFEAMGTITLNDSGSNNNAVLQFNNTCTLTGGTTVFLAGGGDDSQITTAGGATLTLDPSTVVEGSGNIPAVIVNDGLVRAFPSANGDGELRLFSGSKANNATMVAEPGGTLSISGIVLTQDPSAELLADGGTIILPSSQTISGGTVREINGGAVLRPANGTTTFTNVALDADLDIAPNATLIYNGATFDCTGQIVVNNTTSANNGVVQFNNTSLFTGGGEVFLGGGGDDSQLTMAGGVTVTIDTDNSVTGDGLMFGTYEFNGELAPGQSVGLIRGSGTYTFGPTALLDFEAESAGSVDLFAPTAGVVNLGGTLRITPINDYVPVQGEVLTVITAPTINGEFDSTELAGDLPRGLGIRVNYLPSAVEIEFFDCPADIAPPFGGVLNIDDVLTFLAGFATEDPISDFVSPIGTFDIDDVLFFLASFAAGCE